MKKRLNVYVVGDSIHYAKFFECYDLVDKVEDATVVLFTGGEDVTPELYGKEKHPTTYCNISRDIIEKDIFDSMRPDQVAFGICRGSQFLCVMNGGILVQDCDNHAMYGTHSIVDVATGEKYEITSTHHQMQYPYDLPEEEYDLLFKSTDNRCTHYSGDGIDENKIRTKGEPEIVLYHRPGKPKCLAVQGHPEMIPTFSIAGKIEDILIDLVYGG